MPDRRLVFYRWQVAPDRPPFDPTAVAEQIDQRIAADPTFAVLLQNENVTAINRPEFTPITLEHNPVALQLLALRRPDDQPLAWAPGQSLSRLPIGDDEYPSDVTNVLLWNNGLAAHDYHYNAPRLGRLAYFLRTKLGVHVRFQPLYNPDGIDKLMRMQGALRTAIVGFSSDDYAGDIEPGVVEALGMQIWGRKVPSVRITLSMGKFGARDRYLDADVEQALFTLAQEYYDQVDHLVIRGLDPETRRIEPVNLLTERLGELHTFNSEKDIPSLPATQEVLAEMQRALMRLDDSGQLHRAVGPDVALD